jgi:hypothetical protein
MKKFTFFFIMLFSAILVSGQMKQDLQSKIQKMEDLYSGISQRSVNFTRAIYPSASNSALKNAVAVQTLDSIVYQEYDADAEDWVGVWKDEYRYNSELKNTSYVEKEWNGTTGKWEDIGRTELEFNENGQVSVMNIYAPDETSGEIVLLNRMVAHYSPEGRLDSVLHYYADELEVWNVEATQIYHYNELDQLVQMDITSQEEDEGEVYVQTMRFVYTYNSAGSMETSSIYFMDEDMEILFSETRYMYDGSGRLTSSEDSALNFFTFMVEKSSRTEYEYNASGDVSVETTFLWDSDSETWIEDYKDDYSYSNLNYSDVIFPSYFQFWGFNEEMTEMNKAISEIVSSDAMEGSWVNSERTLFYYSEGGSTGTNDLLQASYSVFPNPATDKVTFRWDSFEPLSLEIYHLTGARIAKRQITSGREVSISELNSGIYLYKLIKNNQTQFSGKLIKK